MLKETYGAQKTAQSPFEGLKIWLKATICSGDAHSKNYFESSSCKTTTTYLLSFSSHSFALHPKSYIGGQEATLQ